MATKVAINGFGRIGRLVARVILERDDHDLELVSINDLADTKANALLFGFDSTHGRFPGTVGTDGNDLVVNVKRIHVTAERDPGKLPHKAVSIAYSLEYGVDHMEMHEDAVAPGERVILVDDLIATGGTAKAAVNLLRQIGAEVIAAVFVVDLPDLGGAQKLRDLGVTVRTLVAFEGH